MNKAPTMTSQMSRSQDNGKVRLSERPTTKSSQKPAWMATITVFCSIVGFTVIFWK